MKSFTSTKGGEAPCGYETLIALSKSSEKSYRSLMFSISALFIARSDRQFEWFRWCTELVFKIRGDSELFWNWLVFFNGHCISLDNHCYSLVGLRQYDSSRARDAPFSSTSPPRSFQSERDSGSTQPIFKLKWILFGKRSNFQKPRVGFFKTA